MNKEQQSFHTTSSGEITTYGERHDEIVNLLIYRKFDQCIEQSSAILEDVMCLSTDERITSSECEWLCQVCIQAYAELNRWSEVLPLVTQLFNGIEDCPGNIFQSCMLLHATVKDFPTCSAICNIWLKNPKNFNKPEYRLIVELYIAKVLIELDRWSDIGGFLEKCPGLSTEVQEGYRRHMKTLQRKKEQEELDKIEEITDAGSEQEQLLERDPLTASDLPDSSNIASNQADNSTVTQSKVTAVIGKLSEFRRRVFSSHASQFLQNFALIAFILYLLLTRANFDVLSWETVQSILQTITRLWKAMFAPFHIARTP